MRSVAIAVTTFRNPEALESLLNNMFRTGVPGIPIYVFEDPSPDSDRNHLTECNQAVCDSFKIKMFTAPYWGCMQGIIDYAMRLTREDWIIYVPDDVQFQDGGLINEYEGVLKYGEWFVGGIQAPYWNIHELPVAMHEPIPRNPHWEGTPRKYINLNGAGFSISRRLYDIMGGFPHCTWRLDEWAGWKAWTSGMVCITLPGPPRLHMGGWGSRKIGRQVNFHTEEAWMEATGGLRPADTGQKTKEIMATINGDFWPDIVKHYGEKNA